MNILDNIKGKLTFDEPPKTKVVEKVEESTVYDELKYVEKLCEKAVNVVSTKNKKMHTLNHVKETLKSIGIYENIDNQTFKKIEKLMEEYHRLRQGKENLKAHITENSKKFEHLSHYSHVDIENEIEDMIALEAEQAVIKKDMGHLKFEKDDILDSIEKLEKTSIFVRLLYHFTIFAVSIALVSFVLLISTMGQDIVTPASITAVILVFWIAWLYIASNQVTREMNKYKKLQAREIQLSNKVKVKFANVANVLDFKYKKYNVKSAEDLKKDWDKYQETLDKKYQYHKIFHQFFDIEEQLQVILCEKGICFDEDINMIELISNIKEKMKLKTELENRIKTLNNEINTLNVEQEKLNENLKRLEKEDRTEQKVIKNIIDSYLKDIEQIATL